MRMLNAILLGRVFTLINVSMIATIFGLAPSISNATIINTGESILYNFDFTSIVPAPDFPLTNVAISLPVSSVDPADLFGYKIYFDLNGVNQFLTVVTTGDSDPFGPFISNWSGTSGLSDGIFSVAGYVTSGSVDFGIPSAVVDYSEYDSNTGGYIPKSANLNGTLTTYAPEPSSVALMCLGLAGLGLSRRRKMIYMSQESLHITNTPV